MQEERPVPKGAGGLSLLLASWAKELKMLAPFYFYGDKRNKNIFSTIENMDVWKSEILKAVDNRGGTASYDNIFDDLREFEQSRDRTKYGRKQINLHLRQLLNFGDIIEVSDKLYSLTEKGKRRINRNDFKWVNYAGEDIIECDI